MPVDFSILPDSCARVAVELSRRIEFEKIHEKGATGYILIGRNRTLNRRVVVKFYPRRGNSHVEPRLLADLASDHVLKVDDAASIDEEGAYFIAPFCENGDLDDLIQRGNIGIQKSVDFIIDIAKGASFINGKGYIHRDLKPSNIFCDEKNKLIIGDFGSIVRASGDGYADVVSEHTIIYRTPEEISSSRAYVQGDVYQIGILLFQLLGGYLPYDEKSWLNQKELIEYSKLSGYHRQIYANEIIKKKILAGRLLDYGSLPPWCPKSLIAIIRRCCKVDWADRFANVSDLMVKLHNIRSALPDWRLEPIPTLYRNGKKFQIIQKNNNINIERMVGAGVWRAVRTVNPTSLEEAVAISEGL